MELKKIKKDIEGKWLNAFPSLKKYSQNKFYQITGPLITGIELVKLPYTEEYRPHFVIYSLFGNRYGKDLKSCLSNPILLKEFTNEKGLQFSIPLIENDIITDKVIDVVKKCVGHIFNRDISFEVINKQIEEQFKNSLIIAHPGKQAQLHELLLYLVKYIDRNDLAEKRISKIKLESDNWNMKLFEVWYGNFNSWIQSLTELSRNDLIEIVNTNLSNPKLNKLISYELNNN